MIISFIRQAVYKLYIKDWEERISAERQRDSIRNYLEEGLHSFKEFDEMPSMSYEEYLEEVGYEGEMYVCYEEFLENEYQDVTYMKELLSEELFKMIKRYDSDFATNCEEEGNE